MDQTQPAFVYSWAQAKNRFCIIKWLHFGGYISIHVIAFILPLSPQSLKYLLFSNFFFSTPGLLLFPCQTLWSMLSSLYVFYYIIIHTFCLLTSLGFCWLMVLLTHGSAHYGFYCKSDFFFSLHLSLSAWTIKLTDSFFYYVFNL